MNVASWSTQQNGRKGGLVLNTECLLKYRYYSAKLNKHAVNQKDQRFCNIIFYVHVFVVMKP